MEAGGHGLGYELDRHWRSLTLIAWAGIAAWFLSDKWASVHWFALGDTDDNMRLMQVRALLDGQGWYDLRNYRLDPPRGFDIHWSRLVDLPIAGLILLFRPFTTELMAQKLACGIAPLIPLSVVMLALGATVRRLVHHLAWPAGHVFLMTATVTLLMFMPMRIDHHGWQLALLAVTVAGLCDPRAERGGAIVGLASAASLTIGLEMLPYCAFAGAIIALRWVWEREEARRLQVYALSLAGGCALGFALFASEANRVIRCDALTPVWLSVMVLAGALFFVAGRINPERRAVRLVLAIVGGAIVAGFFAGAFPQCLGRPEQVSDELARNWLNNVREAKPVYKHPFRVAFPIVALPAMGLIGAIVAAWRARGTRLLAAWAPVLLFQSFAAAMLLWQARAGPAAQLLAIPGVTALAWVLFPWIMGSRYMVVRVGGAVVAFMAISGLFAGATIKFLKVDPPSRYVQRTNRATGRCVTLPAMQPLNRYPRATVFTFIDLGPRLIALTHHDAIAGPYHRNGAAILDVQHAFGRAPAEARAIMRRHGATLLLVCPNGAESTIYRTRDRGGFYDRLARGERFEWLEPLPLSAGSPLRLFRVR